MQLCIIIHSFLISSDKHNNDKTPIAEGLIISNHILPVLNRYIKTTNHATSFSSTFIS